MLPLDNSSQAVDEENHTVGDVNPHCCQCCICDGKRQCRKAAQGAFENSRMGKGMVFPL